MPKRRLGKKDVTPKYLNVACGHVSAFMCSFFSLDQCHCSWWWWKVWGGAPKITDEADHILPYGWFVRGINDVGPDGGSGRKGNLLSLFKVFKWFDQSGRLDPGAMPQFGLEALGAALGCGAEGLPKSLLPLPQLPYIHVMNWVAFAGMCCYLPVLHVMCCCGNRCKMVCRLMGYKGKKVGIIISDKIWCSLEVYKNTIFVEVPYEALGHTSQPKHLHVWYFPFYIWEGRFLAQVYHDEGFGEHERTRTFGAGSSERRGKSYRSTRTASTLY